MQLTHPPLEALTIMNGLGQMAWQEHKQAADADFKTGRFPAAATSYTKAIIALNENKSTKPAVMERIKLYANRSLACLKMGDYPEALKDAKTAGKLVKYLGLGITDRAKWASQLSTQPMLPLQSG